MRTFGVTLAMLASGLAGARSQAPAATVSDSVKAVKFFQSESPIAVTLTTNIKRLRGDRPTKAGNSPWRSATLAYAGDEGTVTVPVRVRTRGIWRLQNCEFPPVRFNFSNSATKKTIFHGLDKPKLVSYCRDDDTYEDYILRELQLYRVYHVLTPASHAVRLLRVTYVDSATGKKQTTRYAFVEEDPGAMAERLHGRLLKLTGAKSDDLDPLHDATVGVFQYMIGNTDFALGALHNAELFATANGEYWPIVYDFDFSGAVNARYATVDPRLSIRHVRDRQYRGLCVPLDVYPKVYELFRSKKDAIYALYRDSIGKLMRPGTADETLRYFDEFYKTINDPRSARDEIEDSCLGTKPKR
jgi:hypothetical protein